MLTPWVTPQQLLNAPGAQPHGDVGGWLNPDFSEEFLNLICCSASSILYRLTGRQFAQGGTAYARPARVNRNCGCLPWMFATWGGWGSAWSTVLGYGIGGYSGGACGCPSQAELVLPGPVQITRVTVNGQVLQAGTDYMLLNKRRLVRLTTQPETPAPNTNVLAVWPCCQNLTLPDGSPGTWSVEYAWGQPIPADGKQAALKLAIEMAKAWSGGSSELPERVTSIARQGVTAIAIDPMTFIERGLTGLPLVDLFITSSNPFGLRRRSRVMSPDTIAIEEMPPYQEMLTLSEPILGVALPG